VFVRLTTTLALFAVLSATPVLGQDASVVEPLNAHQTTDHTREASVATVNTALRLKAHGWRYIPPRPKSPQAAPDNPDRRTTWYLGYWHNTKTGATLQHVPKGSTRKETPFSDPTAPTRWRTGGPPPPMTPLQQLLSVEHQILK